jgi:hypothetical protein
VSSEPGPEHVVASTRVATAAHISSIRMNALLRTTPVEASSAVSHGLGIVTPASVLDRWRR